MIEVKTNADQLAAQLAALPPKVFSVMNGAIVRGIREFEGQLIKFQMSGRVSDDYGLNRRTGNLARSWTVKTVGLKGGDQSVILGTTTKYARIHQTGGTINMPARHNQAAMVFTGRKIRDPNSKKKIRETVIRKAHSIGAYVIHIPKRLYVLEDFAGRGKDAIVRNIQSTLQAIFSKK